MVIYNTTFSVPEELKNEFLDFIRNHYIPQAMESDVMKEPRLARIIGDEGNNGLSYALEFKTDSTEALEEWYKNEGKRLYFLILNKFQQNILGFATLMQLIDR